MGQDEQDLLDFLDFVEAELASAKARDKYEQSHVDKLEEIKIKIKDKLKQTKNNSDNSQYAYRPSAEQQKREREEQEQWREAVRQRARQEEEARKARLEEIRKAREAREKEEEAARQNQEKGHAERQKKKQEKIDQDEIKFIALINEFLKRLNVKVHYYIQDEATSNEIELTHATNTDDFFTFIETRFYQIKRKFDEYISKMSSVGDTNAIELVTTVWNKIFKKIHEVREYLERKKKRAQIDKDYLPIYDSFFKLLNIPKYDTFFKLLDIEVRYTLKSKISSELVQVTRATNTDEFYEFIEENKKKISTQSRKFMLKNKSAVLGNVDPDSQEAQDVRLVNDVKDHIFRKLFVNANIAYILKLLHKRLLVLEASAESNLPLRRCSRSAG